MRISIEVPEYTREGGLHAIWEDGYSIETRYEDGEVVLVANPAGLISLARQLLVLAQPDVPPGHHWHFDDANSLEDGSVGLVIERS